MNNIVNVSIIITFDTRYIIECTDIFCITASVVDE